ncbi:sensor histidine kinase [Dactylosporangium sp. CS-033363]|uniref:sensor histidine kinase n=1 Tax=Dactylosporangium sp. CS-033363 TaxID=3239935 RepID=UPI003D9509DE
MRMDLLIGIVVGVVVLVTTHGSPTGMPIEPAALAAVLVACAALALRRRHPFAAFLVSSIAAEVYLIVNHSSTNGTMILAAPLIALYTVAESQSRRRALAIGVLAVLAFAGLHMLVKPSSWLGAENLALAALGGLAVAAGDGARSRREYLAGVEDRARLAEQEHEAEALRRVTEERLRIARDLHDAVGHQLALITVQAGVASQLLDSSPARAREALVHVRRAGRTALDELSDTIGLLRRADEPALPLDPLPGLAGLPSLVAAHRAAGQSITVVGPADGGVELPVVTHRAAEEAIAGAGPGVGGAEVPAAVDLTAYRVFQEALTNACKHAPGAPIRLSVSYEPQFLHVRVDNGPAPPAGEPNLGLAARRAAGPEVEPHDGFGAGRMGGLGLVGMRERVLALGGSLTAGPRPDGGYRVDARLPHSAGGIESRSGMA